MSKISNFLKSNRKAKKVDQVEEPVEPPRQEEWPTEDVDVELVPVSVPKVDAGSEFEDEDIELPPTKVRGTFEWRRSEEEVARLEAKRKEEERRQKEIDERRLFIRKIPGINQGNWVSLEQSAELCCNTTTPTTANQCKKQKAKKNKGGFVLQPLTKTAEVRSLSCKDIWGVVEPWDATEHTWPYNGKDLVA